MKIKNWKDEDGDLTLGIQVEDLMVFATLQSSHKWTLNFSLVSEIKSYDWMDTLTGKGAFKTVRVIRPAIERLISEIESQGDDWLVCCDSRRAKLYSRYIPTDKIKVVY